MLRFANDGGPLLLAPREPRPQWDGVAPPIGGRVVDAASRTVSPVATDYDRACDVEEGAALLPAGDGWVVVLTASAEGVWHPAPPAGVVAIAIGIQDWAEQTTPDNVAALYNGVASRAWTVLGEAVTIGEGGVALLHAGGVRGQDTEHAHDAEYERNSGERGLVFIGDAIVYPVQPGTYRLEAYEHLVPSTPTTLGEHVVLVRFLESALQR